MKAGHAVAGESRLCPHCKATILKTSVACPMCRHVLRFGATLGVVSDVDRALTAFARGDDTLTTACFEQLDRRLAVRPGAVPARASVLAITEAFIQYAVFLTGRA